MANFQIRKYQDEDAEIVKELFTSGMNEHLPSSFTHVLKQPLSQLVLMSTFCGLMASSKSFLLPILAVTLLLAAIRQMIAYLFDSYIEETLKTDLSSVNDTYLKQKDACFWVAESDGQVVGTVACLRAENTQECIELKRMSVRRSHRGMGIAKALCQTVTQFSRNRGYAAVILFTSMVAKDAQKLYERMGYEKIREFALPDFFAKVINFTLIEYRLDLKADKMD